LSLEELSLVYHASHEKSKKTSPSKEIM